MMHITNRVQSGAGPDDGRVQAAGAERRPRPPRHAPLHLAPHPQHLQGARRRYYYLHAWMFRYLLNYLSIYCWIPALITRNYPMLQID